jgi:hypothetical protein
MKDITEVLENLTENNTYATDICLLLYMTDNYTSLYYLDYLNIKGKELENLPNCLLDKDDINHLTQTIRFLRSGFLGMDEIKENLNSKTPIPFITRLLKPGDDWDYVYEDYAGTFRSNLKKNKSR